MSTRHYSQPSTTTGSRKEASSLKRRRLQDDVEEFFDAVQSFKSQARSVTCAICYDDLPSTQFLDISHKHSGRNDKNASIACLGCWENHLHSELERKEWDKLSCLDCGKVIELTEIQRLDSLFIKKIEPLVMEKAAKAYLKTDADWVDCPSSSCKSGSLMVDGHIFTCQECKYRYCFSCKVLMHEGETCTAYKKRMKRDKKHVKDEELSKKKVEKISKPCPKCGIRINKYTGCDHVTCQKCKHEFCWICFASYLGTRGIHRRGNAAHKSSCRYHSGRLPEYEPDDEEVEEADAEAEAAANVDDLYPVFMDA